MTQPPKPVRIGKPLDLNAEALDLAATVTTVDTIMAKALWYTWLAGTPFERFAALLDAVATEGR